MSSLAKTTKSPVVLIIDEFSRTDPARVLGETMTYMESSLRGVPFYLPSGRQASIPSNLVFIATMNPLDRSVDEIDAAMDRRWAKVSLSPDQEKVKQFLIENGATPAIVGATIELFVSLQKHLAVGHAFFRSVKDKDSLLRLWDSQIRHLLSKQLRFDADSLRDAESLWSACVSAIEASEAPAGVEKTNEDAQSSNQPAA
jgi:5-methylcytosine-specific restriction enzyme B